VPEPLNNPVPKGEAGVETAVEDGGEKTDWSGFTKLENSPVGGEEGEVLSESLAPSDKLPKRLGDVIVVLDVLPKTDDGAVGVVTGEVTAEDV
jgi:hypothetical protein